MILGSGYRGTVEQLDGQSREHLREVNFAFVRASGVESVEANVIYAVATKSPSVARGLALS